jgi:hypothetical protein
MKNEHVTATNWERNASTAGKPRSELHKLMRGEVRMRFIPRGDHRRCRRPRNALQARRAEWSRFSQAVNGVLGQADGRIEPA